MRTYICFLFFLFSCFILSSQTSGDGLRYQDSKFNFGYTQSNKPKLSIDDNLYLGKKDISIPLYIYEDLDFNIPITINYSSGGYRTHDPLTAVGIGWNLNAGGQIVRNVNGMSDESAIDYIQPYSPGYKWIYGTFFESGTTDIAGPPFGRISNDNRGIVNNTLSPHVNNLNEVEMRSLLMNGYVINAAPFRQNYRYCIPKRSHQLSFMSSYEPSPDIFSFFMPNHSGKFLFSYGNFVPFETSSYEGAYKIESVKNNNQISFVIKTDDGYEYYFDGEKYGESYHFNTLFQSSGIGSFYFTLSKIVSPNNRIVYYEYDVVNNDIGHTLFGSQAEFDAKEPVYGRQNIMEAGNFVVKRAVPILRKITIDDTIIELDYEKMPSQIYPQFRYPSVSSESPFRLGVIPRLTNVSVKYQSKEICSTSLSYLTSKHNNYMTDRRVSMLKSISYSSGDIFHMHYYDENLSFPSLTYGRDFWGYWNGEIRKEQLPLVEVDDSNVETVVGTYYSPNFKASRQGMLKRLIYPTGGYTDFFYEPHTYSRKLRKDLLGGNLNQQYLGSVAEEIAGGVRIARILNYSDSNKCNSLDYIYREYDANNRSYLNSTGILLHNPRFYIRENFEDSYNFQKVSWLADLISTDDGGHVAYSQVSVKSDDGSFVVYDFSDYKMFPDVPYKRLGENFNIRYTIDSERRVPSYLSNIDGFMARADSRHRIRGKLLTKQYYSDKYRLLQKEEYAYDFDKFNSNLSNIMYGNGRYMLCDLDYYIPAAAYSFMYLRKVYTRPIQLKSITTELFPTGDLNTLPMITNTVFEYNYMGQLRSKSTFSSSSKPILELFKYPIDVVTQECQNKDDLLKNNYGGFLVEKGLIFDENVTEYTKYQYSCFNRASNGKLGYALSRVYKAELTEPTDLREMYIWDKYTLERDIFRNHALRIISERGDSGDETCILWGYNNLYPVAQLKNANLYSLDAALNRMNLDIEQIEHISSTGDLLKLNQLRDDTSMKTSSIMIYTYKPFVGVESIIDARGVKKDFSYYYNGKLKCESIDCNGIPRMLNLYEYKSINTKQ